MSGEGGLRGGPNGEGGLRIGLNGEGGLRIGLIGKLPAHGDFVRRGDLPASFCAAWDAWLQDGIAAARAAIGEERWLRVWDTAPAWRFALPGGACGPDAAAGVLVPSRDSVGRRWPLTLAAVQAGDGAWPAQWFAALEGVARAAVATEQAADGLAAILPAPEVGTPATEAPGADPLAAFWASVDAKDGAGQDEGRPTDRQDDDPAAPMQEDPSPDRSDAAMMAAVGGVERVLPGWWTAASADGTPGLVWPLPALPPAAEFVFLLEQSE